MATRGFEHFTQADVTKRELARKAKPSKYHAVKTTVDGIVFDSKAEARRYTELKALEKAGEIHDLRLQPGFTLCTWHGDHSQAPVVGKYLADFSYCTCLRTPCVRSHVVYEDVKGFRTPLFRWKKKHAELQYGIQIRELR